MAKSKITIREDRAATNQLGTMFLLTNIIVDEEFKLCAWNRLSDAVLQQIARAS
jgi:hypothetical protein